MKTLFRLGFLFLACAGIGAPPEGDHRRDPIRDMRDLFHLDVPAHRLDVILGRPTDRAITVSILAYSDREGQIEWVPADGGPARNNKFDLHAGQPLEIEMGGLDAGKSYTYRLRTRVPGGAWEAEPDHAFRLARAKDAPFVFTVQADSHLDYNTDTSLYLRCLANARDDQPDFLIDLGDTFMCDKHRTRDTAAAQYLAQRYYFGSIGADVPVFLTLGNHDGEMGRWRDGTTDNLAMWSNAQRKRYFPNPEPNAFYSGNEAKDSQAGLLEDYYAWEWGDSLFIVLDPFWYSVRRGGDDGWSWTLGRQQYDWLSATLQRSKAKFRFVFIHHLVGGAGREARGGVEVAPFFEWGGRDPEKGEVFAGKRPGWPMPIHELLVKNHVNIVFHGHDHLFVKQDLDGLVYQEVPQPGNRQYDNTRSAAEYGYQAGIAGEFRTLAGRGAERQGDRRIHPRPAPI